MKIALVCHVRPPEGSAELALALRRRGHLADLIPSPVDPASGLVGRAASGIDQLLSRRGFLVPLAPVPVTVAIMVMRGYDVAHGFSGPDAAAALIWRRMTGGATVFTPVVPVERARLAHRRSALRTFRSGCEASDAVTAPTPMVQRSLARWLAIEPQLLPLQDVDGYELVYRSVLHER